MGDGLNDNFDSYFKVGFLAGIALEIPMGGRFALQPEILYSQRGDRRETEKGLVQTFDNIEMTDPSGTQTFLVSVTDGSVRNFILSYIDIPILFKYKFRGTTLGGNIFVGPNLGFGSKAKFTLDDFKDPSSGQSTLSKIENFFGGTFNSPILETILDFGSGSRDQYKSFDFGAIAGFGLNYNLGSGSIVFDARFLLGLSNIDNSDNENNSLKNRSAQVTLGYMQSFGGGWD